MHLNSYCSTCFSSVFTLYKKYQKREQERPGFFRGVLLFLVIESQVDRALKAGQQSGQVLQAECESLGDEKSSTSSTPAVVVLTELSSDRENSGWAEIQLTLDLHKHTHSQTPTHILVECTCLRCCRVGLLNTRFHSTSHKKVLFEKLFTTF